MQYNPIRPGTSSQGSSYFQSKNPPYGAVFTYNLPKSYKSLKSLRSQEEKELDKLNKDVPFPGWENLDKEINEIKSKIILEVRDEKGDLVDRINGSTKKGINRISWNLTKPLPITMNSNSRGSRLTLSVNPGKYSVHLLELVNGGVNELTESKTFDIKRIRKNVLENPLTSKIDEYILDLHKFEIQYSTMISDYIKSKNKQSTFENILRFVKNIDNDLLTKLKELRDHMNSIDVLLYGSKSKKEIMEKDVPQISQRLGIAKRGLNDSYGPTKNHMNSFDIAKTQWNSISPRIEKFIKEVNYLSIELEQLGAPKILD